MKASNSFSAPGRRTANPDSSKRASYRLRRRPPGLDLRVDAWRPDLADIALADQVAALHYAEPVRRRVTAAVADLRERPAGDSRLGSQLLHGEAFALLEMSHGWAWGFCEHDHYVGYVRLEALGAGAEAPTHVVTAAGGELPIGYRFAAQEAGGFWETAEQRISKADAHAIGDYLPDPVATAESLIGVPYVWGGRTNFGIDCSGLVQVSLGLSGICVPRDSDLQRAAVGRDVPAERLARGDLVFFPDHVGIMASGETLVHATCHWGKVVAESLSDVVARIAAEHDRPVLAYRRILA